jgi:hypothetical protein
MAMVMTQKSEEQMISAHMSKGAARVFQITIISLVLLVGLVLSVVFPFGVGVMLFLGLLVVAGALLAVGVSCVKLFKAILGPSVTFSYRPNMSYLAGRKTAGKKPESEEGPEKEEDRK